MSWRPKNKEQRSSEEESKEQVGSNLGSKEELSQEQEQEQPQRQPQTPIITIRNDGESTTLLSYLISMSDLCLFCNILP